MHFRPTWKTISSSVVLVQESSKFSYAKTEKDESRIKLLIESALFNFFYILLPFIFIHFKMSIFRHLWVSENESFFNEKFYSVSSEKLKKQKNISSHLERISKFPLAEFWHLCSLDLRFNKFSCVKREKKTWFVLNFEAKFYRKKVTEKRKFDLMTPLIKSIKKKNKKTT